MDKKPLMSDQSVETQSNVGTPVPPAKQETSSLIKYASLVALTLQNTVLILVMRYARVRSKEDEMFFATTAVVMAESCKLLTSLGLIFVQEGYSVPRLVAYLNENIIRQPMDCLKVSVPSIIYTLQNNLLYVAVSNLDAATYQVTYQLKILTTALFSVVMLRKEISKVQWSALVILFIGVSVVQLKPDSGKSATVVSEQNPTLGLIAVIISCLMSGFAGVYFEKILKGTKPSVWLRNVQLSFIGILFGLFAVFYNDGHHIQEKGFYHGYDWIVWSVIFLQSFGGLMVAVVVKYADNILKGFATSASIILSCVASVFFFDFHISLQFTVGAAFVILSVYLYGKFIPKPATPPPTKAEV